MTTPKEIGTLVVVVLKARNLLDKHTLWKQDPYAVVRLGGVTKQTAIDKRGGQHPVWDEELRIPVFKVAKEEERVLKVSVFSKENKVDDLLGEGQVDISDTLRAGEFDEWVKLESSGGHRGEVYLEITYYSAEPPPLTRRPSKMPAHERLWRPPAATAAAAAAQTPPKTPPKGSPNHSPHPSVSHTAAGHLAPPSTFRDPSPTRTVNSHLAIVPEDTLPASLSPGVAPHHAEPALAPAPAPAPLPAPANKLAPVPSILRPHNIKSSPTPIPYTSPIPSPHTSPPPNPTSLPPSLQPYHPTPPPKQNAFPPPPVRYDYHPYTSPYDSARQSSSSSPSSRGRSPHQQQQQPQLPGSADERYAIARYQTPLPLPLSASEPLPDPFTAAQQRLASEQARLVRASQEEADAELARVLARNEGIDVGRLREEEERGRRRVEEEERDAEMARRLERELNAGEGDDGSGHVPGEWSR